MLIDAGAQIDAVGDNDYYTPLLACTKRNSEDVAKARNGVRGLQRRNDAFKLGAKLERSQRFIISAGKILSTARVAQEGMFRPDARIVQPGAD